MINQKTGEKKLDAEHKYIDLNKQPLKRPNMWTHQRLLCLELTTRKEKKVTRNCE